ncbi:MAG: YcaO-related McrA-glycine thioamidation protein [Methanobacteriaceae archaeon]|nr:YcaO-related McrA-glycine thioamidation protein [Methanobacteriaceae archaeon]
MFSDIPIKYFNGTHRVKNPSETIENFEDKLRVAGITRITNITDLDRIGVPVFSAIRPTAQEGSVSIYAGKGIGESQAKASAMMEGFERYSAEKQSKDNEDILIGTFNDMSNPIELESLILPKSVNINYLKEVKLEWTKMIDIVSEEEYDVPVNLIFHPYIPKNNDVEAFVKGNTNGLASGNVLEEAVLHGIFEVVERDAWSIFEITKKNKKEIDLNNIENDSINDILDKFERESVDINLLDITADIGIPTVAASSDDTILKDAALLTLGVGTHLNPDIAVLRALTEVAQSRATQIHGTREDTARADFMRKAGYERMKKINRHYFENNDNLIKLSDIENNSTVSIKKDIDTCIEKLNDVGLDKVLFKDLTREEIGVNVVRVIIPNAELYALDPSRVGERAVDYDIKN